MDMITYALAKKAAAKYTDYLFSKVDSISLLFVDALPTTGIKEKTIYFVPRNESPTDYVYNEYMYINGEWRQVGSTELHLEDYYTREELKEELVNILPSATDSTIGGVIVDGKTIIIDENNVISVNFDGSDKTVENAVLDIIKNNIETEDIDFSTF